MCEGWEASPANEDVSPVSAVIWEAGGAAEAPSCSRHG